MNVAIESDEMNAEEDHENRAEVHEEDDYGVHDFHGEVRGEVHEVGHEVGREVGREAVHVVGREAVHEEQKEVRKSGKMSDMVLEPCVQCPCMIDNQ